MNIATNKFREGPFPYIMVLARGGSEVGRGDVFPRHDSNFFNLKFGRFHIDSLHAVTFLEKEDS